MINGSIPEGKIVRHKVCRNRSCCNPKHLRIGTDKDNRVDMLEDGTNWRKLSNEKVLESKFFQDIGWIEEEIARYQGVTRRTIKERLNELKDIDTLQMYSYRAKRILDKESKKNPPIQIIIDREIL